MSSPFGNYAFPPPSLPAPILTNGGSRKNSFAGLSLSTPSSPSFSHNSSKIFHALPQGSNNNRRRSSNPLVYARKRSRAALFFLAFFVVAGWFVFRREVGGGLEAASAISGAFLKQGKEGERIGRIRMKAMRQVLMDELSGSPRRSPSSNHRGAGFSHPAGTTAESSAPPPPPLTPSQELSALLLFLSSSSTNVLPSTIDPSVPLNPDHVLSHSLPSNPTARDAALKEMEKEAWSTWPVVLVGREGDFWAKEARELLIGERYFGKKQEGLGIVYIDRRPDTLVLTPLLSRLTATAAIPSILIGGVPVGGFEQLKTLHDSNKLSGILNHAGATIGRDLEERKVKERRIALAKRQQGK